MKTLVIVNRSRDSVLASQAMLADRWWSRARGFLWRPPPRTGEGMLLSPCRAVHMLGMRHALDVMFLDRRGHVLAKYPGLEPGQRSAFHRHARYALEVPPGIIDASRTIIGDLIAWLPADGNDAGNLRDVSIGRAEDDVRYPWNPLLHFQHPFRGTDIRAGSGNCAGGS